MVQLYIFRYSLGTSQKHVENVLEVDPEKESVFDTFNIEEKQKVLDLQNKVNQYQKKNGAVLFLIDDFIEQASFAKHDHLLNPLHIKARHFNVAIISSSQKYNGLSTTIRTNSTQLIFLNCEIMRKWKVS